VRLRDFEAARLALRTRATHNTAHRALGT
jgi:hypothetical protein